MKGQLIKQHRKFKNMTLEELADGICSVSYLSKIEHNTMIASDEIYRLLGKRLNIRLENLNEEFDEEIYKEILNWHEAIQLKDFPLMDELQEKCRLHLHKNQNIDLSNLYKVVHSRYQLTKTHKPLSKKITKELGDVLSQSSNEFRFLYYKTIGIHHFLSLEYKKTIHHFQCAEKMMEKLPHHDSELYYHFSLTYTRLRMYVESNYYANLALEEYQKSLTYSKITDCYMMLAINYNFLGVHDVAERLFHKLLKGSKEHLSVIDEGRIYHNLGYIYNNQKEYDLAVDHLLFALKLKEREKLSIVSTLYLLAETYHHLEDKQASRDYLSKGEEVANQHKDVKYQHKFYVLKHKMNQTMNDDTFIEMLEKTIIPDALSLNEYNDHKNYLELLAELYYERRMYKKCSMLFIEASRYKSTQIKEIL
ncbi:transcriptional regulator [Halobacillus andaensis]|uniref:Transcriptional regulator n=1 Tax=Halobacillus andaensis TaxID=1176239 RepID=A0A917B380_HALAA|nr:helix-turn-helix transcriptional regulator [Halobacillus andaensis]MBP2004581.1 transcriptional regulator with XRE-family HTH domain [Halobacillus andaensis]GGF20560.1 transcriptional regulator [Halobacillus andaensis]